MSGTTVTVADLTRWDTWLKWKSRLCRLPPGTRRTRPCVLTLAGCVGMGVGVGGWKGHSTSRRRMWWGWEAKCCGRKGRRPRATGARGAP